jgi:hypothetical protein
MCLRSGSNATGIRNGWLTADADDTVLGVVTILVDDLRSFRDGRDAVVVRTSAAALTLIHDLGETFVHELWLDHDLGGDDTIRPVSAYLEEIAYFGKPMQVGVIYVHSANVGAAEAVLKGLIRYGYNAHRASTDQLISAFDTDWP